MTFEEEQKSIEEGVRRDIARTVQQQDEGDKLAIWLFVGRVLARSVRTEVSVEQAMFEVMDEMEISS